MNEINKKLYEQFKKFNPSCEQEERDKDFALKSISMFDDILLRDNIFTHLTSSAFIVNKTHDKVLAIYHNIYDSWGWVGGHADGDTDMCYVATREAHEETSIKDLNLLNKDFVTLDVLPVHGHIKNGKYVSSHTHINVTYIFEADENQYIHIQEDENSNIGWLTFDELLEKCSEPHMIVPYKKLINHIKNINNNLLTKK